MYNGGYFYGTTFIAPCVLWSPQLCWGFENVSIKTACEEMDYLTVEELLNSLNKKAYVEELEKKLMEMLQYCSGFEYEKLEEIIRTL